MSVLMQEWTYRSVKGLIYDWSEVPVCLPFTEGAGSSRCSMSFGGQKAEVSSSSIGAYMAKCKAILSGNRLLRQV